MKAYRQYDVKLLRQCLAWLGVMVVLLMISRGRAAVLFPVAALLAFAQKKTKIMFFTVLMMIVATVGNQFLMPKDIVFAVTVRATLAMVAILMLMQNANKKQSLYVTPLLGILLYAFWMMAPSAFGWSPLISYLKLTLFVSVYFAFYGVANKAATASGVTIYEMRAMMLSVAVFFIGGSALLTFFPSVGMMNLNDFSNPFQAAQAVSLFKGMTMHSQSLGPIVAGLATLLFADMIFAIKRFDWLYMALLLIVPYLVFKTSSRTAMGVLIGGIGIVTWFFVRARGIGQRWRGKVVSAMTFLFLVVVCAAFVTRSARQEVNRFLLKSNMDGAAAPITIDELTSTRQGLVEAAIHNFKKKPLIGNGFQVSEEMQFVNRKSITAYLSAPVEKGVWISAVLEEGGCIGFILFAGFIIVAFSQFVKRRAFISASMLFVITLSNMGEFTFFSMSYTGGVLWVMEFCAVVMDAHREMQETNCRASLAGGWY